MWPEGLPAGPERRNPPRALPDPIARRARDISRRPGLISRRPGDISRRPCNLRNPPVVAATGAGDMSARADSPKWPVVGVLVAVAVTTTMDATGLSAWSALPLFPLLVLFAYLERLPPRRMGFAWGRWRHYGLALLHPALVIGLLAALAAAAGAADLAHADWAKAARRCAVIGISTILVAIVTEEGFFRGWLWASLERAGEAPGRILLGSSLAFALWHVSAVVLKTGFDPPAAQVPTFLVNAAVMGAVWGLLRSLSGS